MNQESGNGPLQRVEIGPSAKVVGSPCISGASIVYDASGAGHSIESVYADPSKFQDQPLRVFCLNEATLRLELTKVKSIFRLADKREMIRITAINSLDVTPEHPLMVNRDGKLLWIKAAEIAKGDLLVTPKTFRRDIAKINWKSAISIPYDSFAPENGSPHLLVAKVGEETHEIRMPMGFNLCIINYLLGLIDASGWIDASNSAIHFRSHDRRIAMRFCSVMSNLFLIEPEVNGSDESGYFIDVTNCLAADILVYGMKMLFMEQDDIIGYYLSGFLDASGRVTASSGKPAIFFDTTCPIKRRRLRKALHVFSILSLRETKYSLCIEHADEIEQFALVTDCMLPENHDRLMDMLDKGLGKDNTSVGYRLGSSLAKNRQMLNMSKSDFDLTPAVIARLEKNGIASLDHAWTIAENLGDRISPGSEDYIEATSIVLLVTSDIIGCKVTSIEKIGEQHSYDVACEGFNNFFANDLLCGARST